MSLTTGRGPLSGNPAGRFTRPVPVGLAYVEPFPRRVRAIADSRTVVDSERVFGHVYITSSEESEANAQGFADRLGDRLLLFDNTGAAPMELLRLMDTPSRSTRR